MLQEMLVEVQFAAFIGAFLGLIEIMPLDRIYTGCKRCTAKY